MSNHNRRVTIREAFSQEVDFQPVGEILLHGVLAFLAWMAICLAGLLACLYLCPREHIEIGVVLGLFVIPGISGLSLSFVLQVIWWRRYRVIHPIVSRRGYRGIFFFAGVTLLGCGLLYGLISKALDA